MPADVERGRRAGFASYLTKPIDLEGLRIALGRIAS
jgi:CheY-like chemotaxis protein